PCIRHSLLSPFVLSVLPSPSPIFSLRSCPPPRSTLFPYTTLFRSINGNAHRSPYDAFTGPNLGYVMEMYESFKRDPESISPDLAEFFRAYGAPTFVEGVQSEAVATVESGDFGKVLAAYTLLDAIRTYGHLAADIYPLNDRPKDTSRIELSYYGLTEADLVEMPAALFLKDVPVG